MTPEQHEVLGLVLLIHPVVTNDLLIFFWFK
jgi:hypothetical protein